MLVKARVPWGSLSVGPQVGFRTHGSRAAAKAGHDANCIHLWFSSFFLFFFCSLCMPPDTHPPPFVKKKANEKYTLARKDTLLPSVQCTMALLWASSLSNKIIG